MTPSELKARLKFHLETHDVPRHERRPSHGQTGLCAQVLDELGVQTVFHKVAHAGQADVVWGVRAFRRNGNAALPGNPRLKLVACTLMSLTALLQLQWARTRSRRKKGPRGEVANSTSL